MILRRVKAWVSGVRFDRLTLAVTMVLALILLIDFATRVWVSLPETARVYSAPGAVELRPLDSLETANAKLSSWLPVSLEEKQKADREIFFRGSLMQVGEIRAVVSLRSSGKTDEEWVVVRTGDTVDSWTVGAVQMRELELVKGDQRRTVTLLQSK